MVLLDLRHLWPRNNLAFCSYLAWCTAAPSIVSKNAHPSCLFGTEHFRFDTPWSFQIDTAKFRIITVDVHQIVDSLLFAVHIDSYVSLDCFLDVFNGLFVNFDWSKVFLSSGQLDVWSLWEVGKQLDQGRYKVFRLELCFIVVNGIQVVNKWCWDLSEFCGRSVSLIEVCWINDLDVLREFLKQLVHEAIYSWSGCC